MANTLHRSQIGLDGKYLLSQKWECALPQQLSVLRYNFLTQFNISKSVKLHYRKIYPAEFSCLPSCPKICIYIGKGVEDLCRYTSRNLSVLPQSEWKGEYVLARVLTDSTQRRFHQQRLLMHAGTEER